MISGDDDDDDGGGGGGSGGGALLPAMNLPWHAVRLWTINWSSDTTTAGADILLLLTYGSLLEMQAKARGVKNGPKSPKSEAPKLSGGILWYVNHLCLGNQWLKRSP